MEERIRLSIVKGRRKAGSDLAVLICLVLICLNLPSPSGYCITFAGAGAFLSPPFPDEMAFPLGIDFPLAAIGDAIVRSRPRFPDTKGNKRRAAEQGSRRTPRR